MKFEIKNTKILAKKKQNDNYFKKYTVHVCGNS